MNSIKLLENTKEFNIETLMISIYCLLIMALSYFGTTYCKTKGWQLVCIPELLNIYEDFNIILVPLHLIITSYIKLIHMYKMQKAISLVLKCEGLFYIIHNFPSTSVIN